MPPVLILSDSVACPHPSGLATKTPAAKLTVGSAATPVVTGMTAITGCLNGPPPMGATPCSAVTNITGAATKLTVGGQPVLLSTTKGQAVGTPGGALTVTASQTKLNAV